MKYRTLGRTNLCVSLVSLGTGGPSRIGQRTHADESVSHRVVQRALDLGINLIDTAADYSDSESILGRALANGPRDRYLLATKFNPDPEENDQIISPAQLVESCERSLRRLRVEHLDIYQFHGLVPSNYQQAVERLFPTMERLRDRGRIRFIGVTEYFYRDPDHQMLHRALESDLWDTIMVKYGILNLAAEWEVLPLAQQRNVGVMNMSPVRVKLSRPTELEQTIARWKQAGLLAADAVPDRNPLGFLVHGKTSSVIAAGYKFGSGHPAIATVLVGTGNVAHLEENVETILGPPLSAEDQQRIRDLFGSFAVTEGGPG